VVGNKRARRVPPVTAGKSPQHGLGPRGQAGDSRRRQLEDNTLKSAAEQPSSSPASSHRKRVYTIIDGRAVPQLERAIASARQRDSNGVFVIDGGGNPWVVDDLLASVPISSFAAADDRAQLRCLLDQLDAGDVLMVTRLDRLARSTRDLLNTLAAITEKKDGFRSLADTWADTTTPHGRLAAARRHAEQKVCRLFAGGRRIRTIGPAKAAIAALAA
jgi:hypothetical protein